VVFCDTGATYSVFPFFRSSELQNIDSLGEKKMTLSRQWQLLHLDMQFPILVMNFLGLHLLVVDTVGGW
jgi:hypothetical protein